jgi:membrane protein
LQIPLLDPSLELLSLLLPIAGLGILTWLAYRLIPYEHPSAKAALRGSLLCVGLYTVVSFGFRELIDFTRYNLLYGTLGNLLILLANVYFFFMFFYWGAQYAFVEDAFDELSFQHYRRISHQSDPPGPLTRRVFSAPKKLMQNYERFFADGEYLYHCGDAPGDVFYIVRGAVSLVMEDANGQEVEDSVIEEGGFVGETDVLLGQKRASSARASGDTQVLGLPPELFSRILHTDPGSSLHVIENLSQRVNRTRVEEGAGDPDADRGL